MLCPVTRPLLAGMEKRNRYITVGETSLGEIGLVSYWPHVCICYVVAPCNSPKRSNFPNVKKMSSEIDWEEKMYGQKMRMVIGSYL